MCALCVLDNPITHPINLSNLHTTQGAACGTILYAQTYIHLENVPK